MNNFKATLITLLLLILVSSSFLFPAQVNANDKKIELGYVNWAGTVAETFVTKAVLEKKLNYDVKTTMVGAGPVYSALAQGDIDAFLGAWLPITHRNYINEYENEIIKSGPNYLGAKIGLVVPDYVDINSIEELNENKDKFDGKIVGIDPGAGVMEATHEAIKKYNLDMKVMASSGPAMVGALKDAIENKEWIVVTGWNPHYKFARYDLKFLNDSKNVYGQKENIYSFHHPSLAQEHPQVVNYLHDFRMTSQQLGEVMGLIADGMEAEKAGVKWVKENNDIVEDWLKSSTVSE